MVEPNERLELHRFRFGVEVDQGDAITEGIVDPPDFRRLRRHLQMTLEQTLVEAVPGPKHELVQPRPHRIFVTIEGRMMNRKNRHGIQTRPFSTWRRSSRSESHQAISKSPSHNPDSAILVLTEELVDRDDRRSPSLAPVPRSFDAGALLHGAWRAMVRPTKS
jgi:hypothetical protein